MPPPAHPLPTPLPPVKIYGKGDGSQMDESIYRKIYGYFLPCKDISHV